MNEQIIPTVRRQIEEVRDIAEIYGVELEQIFRKLNFNPKLIIKYGALCTDVEFGPEIEALKKYHPHPFVVSENKGDGDYDLKDLALKELGRGLDLTIVRNHYQSAMDLIKSKGQKVGLITRLNIFPKWIPKEFSVPFIKRAVNILAPEGLILLSVAESEYMGYLKSIAKAQIPNVKMTVLPMKEYDFSLAGSGFLAATLQR